MNVAELLNTIPALRHELAQHGIEGERADRLIEAAAAQLRGRGNENDEVLLSALDARGFLQRLDNAAIVADTGLDSQQVDAGIEALACHVDAYERSAGVLARLSTMLGAGR